MKIKIITLFFLLLTPVIYGQELKMAATSQYLADNPYVISGAYAGIGEFYELRFIGETQWLGVKDAPQTQSVSFDGRIGDRSGMGILIFNDKNRNTSQKGGQVSYAHHLTLSEYNNQFLSFGLSYKFTNFNIDISDINSSDPTVQSYNETNSNFDLSFLYRLESFFFSFNAVNILDRKSNSEISSETATIRNYYLYSGFVLKSKFSSLEYEPSVFYQIYENDGRSSADVNFKIRKMSGKNYIWAGLSLRMLGDQNFEPSSIAPLFGLKQSKFYVGYSFNASLNELQNYSAGTHMLTLGYDFDGRRSPCKCVN